MERYQRQLRRLFEGRHLMFDPLRHAGFQAFKIVMGLEVQPALGVRAEEAGQAQGGFRGNSSFTAADFVDAALRNAYGLGKAETGDVEWLKKILQEDFAGVDRRKIARLHGLGSFNHGSMVSPGGWIVKL